MLDSVDYASLLQYSPRGTSGTCKNSRKIKDTIKAGRIDVYRNRISVIINENKEMLAPFLNEGVTLVPAPRSSPIQEGALWPALEICKLLSSLNLGVTAACLLRREAIRKSSLCFNADERPSITEQFKSMAVANYVPTENITLIDDVLTLGRTSIAGASRLAEKFPNANMRVFSLIRTNGFVHDIESILDVKTGIITYNPFTDKCTREP